jgi:hypothetical protein
MTCSHKGCEAPATATVLAGATRVPYCFLHEREYADRYGCMDIYPLMEAHYAQEQGFQASL